MPLLGILQHHPVNRRHEIQNLLRVDMAVCLDLFFPITAQRSSNDRADESLVAASQPLSDIGMIGVMGHQRGNDFIQEVIGNGFGRFRCNMPSFAAADSRESPAFPAEDPWVLRQVLGSACCGYCLLLALCCLSPAFLHHRARLAATSSGKLSHLLPTLFRPRLWHPRQHLADDLLRCSAGILIVASLPL